ncbi:hypothetical protein GMORB2_0608 [Geosmithia morbida]|uniref:Uncharacterized protein n=1 Tax=Geosmithia morbida TaxID=1094350 RepID=A0A9P5D7Q7_9HYPO|nr:uncharacterized protein GMORB2_0608 [Geosmithia morbida]KAF4126871.1 hypothetical protein GMORB2_0608 [Geosmithia morbida]
MARSLLGSLGHRSRTGSPPDVDVSGALDDSDHASVDGGGGPPPSCLDARRDGLRGLPQHQLLPAELQAEGIYEIGSDEVSHPTVAVDIQEAWRQDDDQWQEGLQYPFTMAPPPPPPPPPPPQSKVHHPAELSDTVVPSSLSVLPASAAAAPSGDNTLDIRPSLRLETAGLTLPGTQPYKSRSRTLAPSSSVRSTNSTNSTSSIGSCTMSTMSTCSGGWGHMADSATTTPTEDFCPDNPFAPSLPSSKAALPDPLPPFQEARQTYRDDGHSYPQHATDRPDVSFTELPAEMRAPIPPPQPPPPMTAAPPMDLLDHFFPFSVSTPQSQPRELAGPLMDASDRLVDACSLIQTVCHGLKADIGESRKRLQDIAENNHLAKKLIEMPPEQVVKIGLDTLDDVQRHGHGGGQTPAAATIPSSPPSPINTICLIHLFYASPLRIQEHDAQNRCWDVFRQVVSYSTWLGQPDRDAYLHVVDALWKPPAMSCEASADLTRGSAAAAAEETSPKSGGGVPQMLAWRALTGPLALIAVFLDGL